MNVHRPAVETLPKAILVGVDDAGLSDHALEAALDLGDRLGARVELIHALRLPLFEWLASDPAHGPAATQETLRKTFERVNDRLRAILEPRRGASETDLVRVHTGAPAAVLLDVAREKDVDLIVLGTHGRRTLIDFGSTARAVLAKGTMPVWIQTRPPRRIETVLAPIDLSEDSLRALSLARAFAKALGARVRVVHFFDVASLVATTPDALGYVPTISVLNVRERALADFESAMASFDWKGIDHEAEFLDGRPAEGIVELSQSADLIVLGTHGRTGLASAVLGGVAHAVLKRSECAILAVPHPGRKFLI